MVTMVEKGSVGRTFAQADGYIYEEPPPKAVEDSSTQPFDNTIKQSSQHFRHLETMYPNSIIVGAILASTTLASPLSQPLTEPATAKILEKRITHSGRATFYEQNGAAGSCGQVHAESDRIIALPSSWQGSGYPPAYCGRKIEITNKGGGQNNNGQGKVVVATVADTCPGCGRDDLGKYPCSVRLLWCKKRLLKRYCMIDLSHGTFQALTGGALDPPGQFNIDWYDVLILCYEAGR
ncbi:MAG: hypothetical protein Q9186_007342 [Xanthomendoza sp. 1 TL-2023]